MSWTPKFAMPIIEPPPPGDDPAVYYAAILENTALQVEGVANNGLKISLSNPAYRKLYAIIGGTVTFFPPGEPIPILGEQPSPGAGSLHLRTHPGESAILKKDPPTGLPPGVSLMTDILYLNVNALSARSAFDPIVRAAKKSELLGAWGATTPSFINDTEMQDAYLELLLKGAVYLLVEGGAYLGDAESEFTLRLINSTMDDLSPIPHLRSMPNYGGAKWNGHPLIGAIEEFPEPVDFWLKFEVWDINQKVYVPLSKDIDVSLMDYDPITPNDILGEPKKTIEGGIVHFNIPDLQALDEPQPDIFFLVHTDGIECGGHILPAEWSTRGWDSVDGRPGYYENFPGGHLGDEENPVIFRIGVDFHVACQYVDNSGNSKQFPKGIPITLCAGFNLLDCKKKTLETDEKGEIHNVVFNISAEDSVYFGVSFQIKDDSIKLPKASVNIDDWVSCNPLAGEGDDKTIIVNNTKTSIYETHKMSNPNNLPGDMNSSIPPYCNTYENPFLLVCATSDRNIAIYFLKILRELSIFLFKMTSGDWLGVEDLKFYLRSASNVSYSWPVGQVNIPPSDHWDRGNLVHEISHQIMWKEVNYSSLGIVYEAIFGGLILIHSENLFSNQEQTLIEGWAEFIAAIFSSLPTPPYYVIDLVESDGSSVPGGLGPPPDNRGLSVEGAFANGLWTIFERHVVTSSATPDAHIHESTDGDVTKDASWILNSNICQRFFDIIWTPLKNLKPLDNPMSLDMLRNIYKNPNNSAIWNSLKSEFQAFNMAMGPAINTITPASGPLIGGQNVTIEGRHFDEDIQVKIGGVDAYEIRVISNTVLTAKTPVHPVGQVDVVVTTLGGSATRTNGYAYV